MLERLQIKKLNLTSKFSVISLQESFKYQFELLSECRKQEIQPWMKSLRESEWLCLRMVSEQQNSSATTTNCGAELWQRVSLSVACPWRWGRRPSSPGRRSRRLWSITGWLTTGSSTESSVRWWRMVSTCAPVYFLC